MWGKNKTMVVCSVVFHRGKYWLMKTFVHRQLNFKYKIIIKKIQCGHYNLDNIILELSR